MVIFETTAPSLKQKQTKASSANVNFKKEHIVSNLLFHVSNWFGKRSVGKAEAEKT